MLLPERDWLSNYFSELLLALYHNLIVHFDSSYREIIDLLCSFLYNCYGASRGRGGGFILPHFCITARVTFKTRSLIRLKIRRHSCCFCFFFYATVSETVSVCL